MKLHSSKREKFCVFGGLALTCMAPVRAAWVVPRSVRDREPVSDAVQADRSSLTSQKTPESSQQQDVNSQPVPSPLTPEQSVSKPPEIIYKDGQLTIVAENSLLSEVMSALRSVMGADVDLPASAASQRIWVRLGPGPARRVLRDLLDNTELNYVIQASETDTEGIRSVMLTLRSKAGEQGGPGSQMARAAGRRNQLASSTPTEVPEQESSTPSESTAAANLTPADSPVPSPSAQSVSIVPPSIPGAPQPASIKPGAGSTDQMIQQLQSMYEQRRQLQMQQNRKPPSPNN
jgi:hypothetical protein